MQTFSFCVFVLLCCLVLAVEGSGSNNNYNNDNNHASVSANSRHRIAAAVRLANKNNNNNNKKFSSLSKIEANKLATVDVSAAVGEYAREHPKLPGQDAMLEVAQDSGDLGELRDRLEKQLSKEFPSDDAKEIDSEAEVAITHAINKLRRQVEYERSYRDLTAVEKQKLHQVLTQRASATAAGFLGEAIQRLAMEHPKSPGRNAMIAVVKSVTDKEFVVDHVEDDLKQSNSVKSQLPPALYKFVPLVARGVARVATRDAVEYMRKSLKIE